MRFLTTEEARLWCVAHGLKVSPNRFLYYDVANMSCFSVGLEDKSLSVIGLANYLVPTWEENPFGGALLWIRQRGVWGDFSENTGAMIIQQMRSAKGEAEPLNERPGYLFGPDELIEM